jgi:hypothetical protein
MSQAHPSFARACNPEGEKVSLLLRRVVRALKRLSDIVGAQQKLFVE